MVVTSMMTDRTIEDMNAMAMAMVDSTKLRFELINRNNIMNNSMKT